MTLHIGVEKYNTTTYSRNQENKFNFLQNTEKSWLTFSTYGVYVRSINWWQEKQACGQILFSFVFIEEILF